MDLAEMISNLADGLVREHLRMRVGLGDGLGVIRPLRVSAT